MPRPTFGLRARLMLLVSLAVIPAFALIGHTALSQRQQAAEDAQRDALNLVRLAAREQEQLIVSTRQLLQALSQLPSLRRPGVDCRRILGAMLKPNPYYTNFGVAGLDGRIFCSALPMTRTVNITDRSYFRRSLRARDFGVGDYQIGRITGIPAINFGYPVTGEQGEMRAVVYAALNLSWLNRLVTGIELPAGSTVTVVDSRGTILARHPQPEKWVGKNMTDSALIKAMLSHRSAGTSALKGMDGTSRLYAFTSLHAGPSGTVHISVGIPESVAFAAANQAFLQNMTGLALVAVLALLAAWVGSKAFILRRVNALTVAARRLAAGDLAARSGLPAGTGELEELAATFDDMAMKLERVNRALKTLSAGNRTVVRATDEQSLLEQMCRVLVEVGGYRFAWVGYVKQNDSQSVEPLAEAGYEGGLEALAKAVEATAADFGRGRTPAARAIQTESPCILRHVLTNPEFAPWREDARRRGYASTASLPLRVRESVIGVLSIYAEQPDAFDGEEMELLSEATGDLAFGVATLRARTEHERTNEIITRMAYYDGLTGLPNHVHLEERLRQAMGRPGSDGASFALLLLDLARFREINDALGFQQGDRLLKEVAARLQTVLTDNELIARMRGDEFAILLPANDAGSAIQAALRLLSVLEEPFELPDLTLAVNGVIGISLYPRHGTDAARLIRHADVAMHKAKKSGKSCVVYDAQEDQDTSQRLALVGDLRHAIAENDLVLHYQPKIDLRSGRPCGAEALVRWVHRQQGMIPPDDFIGLAEHTGLIKPLTDWVLQNALDQVVAWHRAGLHLPVAVNLSAHNLRDPELLDKVEGLLVASGATAAWLEIEITESVIMEDPEAALDILTRLRNLGVTLFIDDFGTGYSSLAYLKKLQVNAIKIDKGFVVDMLSDVDSDAIVRSTISLAHDLSLKVVAEGVENRETQERLAALGCDVVQGYHISKPLPADQFRAWWSRAPR